MNADEILKGTLDIEWDAVENSENGSQERKQAVDNVNKLYETAAKVDHQIWLENHESDKLAFEKEKYQQEKAEKEAKEKAEKKEKRFDKVLKVIGIVLQFLGFAVPAALLGYNLHVQHKHTMHDVIPDPDMKTAEREAEQWSMKRLQDQKIDTKH